MYYILRQQGNDFTIICKIGRSEDPVATFYGKEYPNLALRRARKYCNILNKEILKERKNEV